MVCVYHMCFDKDTKRETVLVWCFAEVKTIFGFSRIFCFAVGAKSCQICAGNLYMYSFVKWCMIKATSVVHIVYK